MRIPERISIIMEVLKDHDKLVNVLATYKEDFIQYLPNVVDKLNIIENIWKQFPDYRLSQVLTSQNIIPNVPGMWFYKEDEDVMIESGCLEERDIYFWGKNFNKEGKLLTKTEFILIKNMETSHIKSILRDNEEGLLRASKKYLEMFNRELNYRRTYNIN